MSDHEYGEKIDQTSSLEKGPVQDYVVQQTDNRYHFDAADLDRVQRKLKQRHVQMIAVSPAFTFRANDMDASLLADGRD